MYTNSPFFHERHLRSLVREAVPGCVDREVVVVTGIQRGLNDVEAGRVIGHDDAMRALYAVISAH